ncbi:hypothetical protein NC653_001613 [Populus alba x Populus x berolinensis]|uniref:PH domain-containing protein n=1 Tax=Populus alba x Populus x berolinensis TaxID=444605 RepID=A0AAD6RLP4_9ROSI|nr:hypothetical protein NC653_001613 [Populus alba x Populus x berolinensis]
MLLCLNPDPSHELLMTMKKSRELDRVNLILNSFCSGGMLAHKYVKQSSGSHGSLLKETETPKTIMCGHFGWNQPKSDKDESDNISFQRGGLSATASGSLIGVFYYKPFDAKVDWSMTVKAAPCYMTYLKDSIDGIINFFESSNAVSQTIALETAAAVQMTFDGVKRSAQQQVNRALKDHARFLLDLDIAAPKITIPTEFYPDNIHSTKLLLDLGNLVIRSEDDYERRLSEDQNMYLQFDLVLSDVCAFLVDGDYRWSQTASQGSASSVRSEGVSFLPVIDRCGVILTLQQIRLENPSYPSTRLSVRVPSLGFHFSPARYHRLMRVAKIFQEEGSENSDLLRPWNQSDFEGWLSLLIRKGMGNREAVWQRRYICLVGPFLYVLENLDSKSYKHYLSLRGKQVYHLPAELLGGVEHVLTICDAARPLSKVVEDVNALILRCDSDDSQRNWQSRLQGAIYSASGSAPITTLSETSSDPEDSETELNDSGEARNILKMERIFITGALDELKICFNYNRQRDLSFVNVLLAEENRLFEFRAIGGQVELSMRENDMFIGTVLKSLEIEDLVCCNGVSQPCFLARSFVQSSDVHLSFDDTGNQTFDNNNSTPSEGEDKFYEAPENLVNSDYPSPQNSLSSEYSSFKPPSFSRVAGLLPGDVVQARMDDIEIMNTMDSFVKAQIVIYDHNSSLYKNIDTQVTVSLATLSFFCRRPTILAIMEFVNAINVEDEKCETFSDNSPSAMVKHDSSGDDIVDDQDLTTIEEPAVKDNLLTDIKVFPSSFSIKAALGNLRISDDSLPGGHAYFWICDMRNYGGSSFVELVFTSFSADDEDYEGYEYSLFGQLSEVRIVYLNRFIQEVASYFMGLIPNNSKTFVKLKDQVTNSEKWFTISEIEGSPALKLDLSLRKPIILMPRRTDSPDFLKLDVVHITIQNTFQWLGGSKGELHAVHLEILTIKVTSRPVASNTNYRSCNQGIELCSVGLMEELKAALTSRDYQIITECATSNISETPHTVPPLNHDSVASSADVVKPIALQDPSGIEAETRNREAWISLKVSVAINLVELCLYAGVARDASLATIKVSGAWLLYKSNNAGEGFLSATLKGFTVIDDREGTEEEFRLAVGMPEKIGYSLLHLSSDDENQHISDLNVMKQDEIKPVPTMLIFDAKFGQYSTFISLCVQRPQLLVALDFLLAVAEFFVPAVGDMLSNEESRTPMHEVDAVVLDQPIYQQSSAEISLSPLRPLIVDDERFDHFTYDGKGGILHLKDRQGVNLSAPSKEAIIYVGSGKKLQFKNVVIKNGKYLDSCIFLGSDSGYSVSRNDQVQLEGQDDAPLTESSRIINDQPSEDTLVDRSTEFIIELQAISPELTFYNTSKDVGVPSNLSNKLLHAQLDAFARLVLKGNTIEMTANVLGLMMESNGITILEPFDTSVKYSNASGKTNIHLSVSDIFMNFTFSILRLFLAVEEDILSFLRMTSKKTISCSQFDKVGTITNPYTDQIYAFWRPCAPPGYAILGDYLTPLDKPPTKGVVAVNTNFARVKRPISFKLIWPPLASEEISGQDLANSSFLPDGFLTKEGNYCSIWFPEAPKGYVALGCVVSPGRTQPPLSAAFCISASLVSSCSLRDCIAINSVNSYQSTLAFWRVDNSVGTFLPADPVTLSLIGRAYELRDVKFGFLESSSASSGSDVQASPSSNVDIQPENSTTVNSGRCFEVVASFQLIWWNQSSSSRNKLSIWRPVVPHGMVYFGDIAVKGYVL